MKNIIPKLTVFLLTYFFGLSIVFIRLLSATPFAQVEQPTDLSFESPIEASLCYISDSLDYFDGRLVKLKATTYAVDRELVLSPLDCQMQNPDSHFLFPRIEIKNSDLLGILDNHTPRSNHPDYKDFLEVDVQVTGVIKVFYDERGSKRFSVVPKRIKIISPFRQVEPRGAA